MAHGYEESVMGHLISGHCVIRILLVQKIEVPAEPVMAEPVPQVYMTELSKPTAVLTTVKVENTNSGTVGDYNTYTAYSDDPCRAYARQNAVNINNKARYLHCSHLGIRWLLRDYIARKEPHYHQEHK